jgi:predicted patatin/cPLA2 family phospholipase
MATPGSSQAIPSTFEFASVSEGPSVLGVLESRKSGIKDNYVVAVALEGGGLRGVVSGAMLIALRDLGYAEYVDNYYGTSSGSINITYFSAGASWEALSVYYDHLTRGFLRGKTSIGLTRLDMGYLETVMRERVPLDSKMLSKSAINARIVLTNVDTMTPEIVKINEVDDPISYLLAGSWLPILAGKPRQLHGVRYLDGGVLWADPIYAAVSEGCTHVLALNTSASGDQSEHSKRLRTVLRMVLNGWESGLGDQYMSSRIHWDSLRKRLGAETTGKLAAEASQKVNASIVTRVTPAIGSHRVERLTMNRADLLDGARVGYSTIKTLFGSPGPHYFSIT